jgi:glucose/arabinose dehydrogenase
VDRVRGRGLVALALAAVLAAAAVVAVSVSFAGETGSRALRLARVASGFQAPVYVTSAPGETGRLYVVEQRGVIKVLERGKIRAAPFLDVRSKVKAGGEQGLLGLAFARDYRKSRVLVVNYTDVNGDTRVVRYKANKTRALPGTARVLLTVPQPFGNHNGGMVEFGPDGLLYVGMGDGGSADDPGNRAQSMATLLGKLVRLDAKKTKPAPRIVALGLRNPWRFSFDRATRDLWIGDVGQYETEEIDVLRAGTKLMPNFGWSKFEGSREYLDKALGPGRLTGPVAVYSHESGCSVTGGYVYRGKAVPAARGRYFYGDYCSGRVWSLSASAPNGSVRVEPFRVDAITSFGEDGAGELDLVSQKGTIFRLAR